MKLVVNFAETDQTFKTNFEAVHNITDGGYERGYDAGYIVGNTEGYKKGHAAGVKEGYDEGYNVGNTEGYKIGLEEGSQKGVEPMLTNSISNLDTSIETLRDYACYSLSNLLTVNIPNVTRIGPMTFRACTRLTTVNAPNVKSVTSYCFYSCTRLNKVDFPSLNFIGASSFHYCTSLNVFILRSITVANLENSNAFSNTPIASGTGHIYVPANLVEQYKAATNWSTYANQFRAIEDYPDICSGGDA